MSKTKKNMDRDYIGWDVWKRWGLYCVEHRKTVQKYSATIRNFESNKNRRGFASLIRTFYLPFP
jgi:hypothetical protein